MWPEPLGARIVWLVMPALIAGIHVFLPAQPSKTWMAGTSPAMTTDGRAIVSTRQERHRQLVKHFGRIPRHQVLAAVGKMQIELRVALLEQLGALLGAGAIVASVDQEQWLFQLDQTLPQRH